MFGAAVQRIPASSFLARTHPPTHNLKLFQKQATPHSRMTSVPVAASAVAQPSGEPPLDIHQAAQKFGWEVDVDSQPDFSGDRQVMELPVAAIRRPLQGVRTNNQEKVEVLKRSIEEIGLREPIDVLEVDGQYWGFSGCHRFQAHQELGKETILCRVRKATPQVLRYHMM